MRDSYGDEERSYDGARLTRAKLTKTADDGDQQLVDYDGMEDEKHTGVNRVAYHGLSSHAPPGSDALILTFGERDAPFMLGAESPKDRPTDLPEGGTRIYDTSGSYTDYDADGNISHVSTKGMKFNTKTMEMTLDDLTINCPNMTFNGDIKHNGNMETSGVHKDSNGEHV